MVVTLHSPRFEDMNKADEEKVEHEAGITDSFLNPRTIMKYMNPAEWFKGKMSTTEAVVMSVMILVTLVLLLVLIKICSCCSCLIKIVRRICCCKKTESGKVRRDSPELKQLELAESKSKSKKVGFSGKAASII